MPQCGHSALPKIASSASTAASALPCGEGVGSCIYFCAQFSQKCNSSNFPWPITSVMCRVAGFGHFMHLCMAFDPDVFAAGSLRCILTGGLDVSRNRQIL